MKQYDKRTGTGSRTAYYKSYHDSRKLKRVWTNFNHRCNDIRDKNYHNYGGRGISVCKMWHQDNPNGFENFYKWAMANGYSEGLDLDRTNNSSGYKPSNARFVTHAENIRNSRVTKTNIEDVRKMRMIYSLGVTVRGLHKIWTNLTTHAIYAIVSGRTWKEVIV